MTTDEALEVLERITLGLRVTERGTLDAFDTLKAALAERSDLAYKLGDAARFLIDCRGTEPAEYFEHHASACAKAAAVLRGQPSAPPEGAREDGVYIGATLEEAMATLRDPNFGAPPEGASEESGESAEAQPAPTQSESVGEDPGSAGSPSAGDARTLFLAGWDASEDADSSDNPDEAWEEYLAAPPPTAEEAEHVITWRLGGGDLERVQPVCSCGWSGHWAAMSDATVICPNATPRAEPTPYPDDLRGMSGPVGGRKGR